MIFLGIPADSSNNYEITSIRDNVFLLSSEEMSTYYCNSTSRQEKGTDYAKCQGLYTNSGKNISNWWLRSLGKDGFNTYDSSIGVRPTCWIKYNN